eukprot:s3833_g1.t1
MADLKALQDLAAAFCQDVRGRRVGLNANRLTIELVLSMQRSKLKKLFQQIDAGDQDGVFQLLETEFGGDVNVADETGTTPLLLAASLGKQQMVQALMEKKADLMASDLEGDNVLMMAISQNHLDIVQVLLAETDSVDPDVPNKIGQTPLMKAELAESVSRPLHFAMQTATATPPHLSDAESEMPPPSPSVGVVLEFRGRTTVGQIAMNLFELDYEVPGLLRFSDVGSTIMAPTTPVAIMRYPRMMYIQVGAYSEFKRAATVFSTLQHVAHSDRAVQEAADRLQVRIFMHFVSPFRALDQQSRHLSMTEAILDRLRTRLDRVEYAYANGLPLQLSPRPTPQTTAWDEAYIAPEELHPLAASVPASEAELALDTDASGPTTTHEQDPDGPDILTGPATEEAPDAAMTPASSANP